VTQPTHDEAQWTESRPSSGRRKFGIAELWEARELVAFLALRDVKVRYKQAVFGSAWAIGQPLAGAAIFTVVFGKLAKISSGDVPYLVFAFAGFSIWSYFSTSVDVARASLVGNSALITKVYFPRLAVPLASVLPSLIDLGVAIVVLAGMCVWTHSYPGFAVLLAPVFLLQAILVAFGAGALFAAVTVQFRDVQQVFGLLLQLWLFATPVAYPDTLVHGGWRWLYAVNPMVGAVDGWRWAAIGAPAPGREALLSALVAIVLLYVGLSVFKQTERRFADVI
jgi:ABC-type polysaccharide/polyol phosphate export permease